MIRARWIVRCYYKGKPVGGHDFTYWRHTSAVRQAALLQRYHRRQTVLSDPHELEYRVEATC